MVSAWGEIEMNDLMSYKSKAYSTILSIEHRVAVIIKNLCNIKSKKKKSTKKFPAFVIL